MQVFDVRAKRFEVFFQVEPADFGARRHDHAHDRSARLSTPSTISRSSAAKGFAVAGSMASVSVTGSSVFFSKSRRTARVVRSRKGRRSSCLTRLRVAIWLKVSMRIENAIAA